MLRGRGDNSENWTHEAHIRTAWIYCTREHSLSAEIGKAREGIRRLNAANGLDSGRYHETITVAYMTLVSLRIPEFEGDWSQFRQAHPELFDTKEPILRHYYTDATLESDAVRKGFVGPQTPFSS